MLDIFTAFITFGLFLIFIVGGTSNGILGWSAILFGFALTINPAELYKQKVVSSVLIGAFFITWFVVINLSAVSFINLLAKVESSNGFTSENVSFLFLTVVFIALLIASTYLFIRKLVQTVGEGKFHQIQ